MSWLEALVLGVVQGLTEYLPVSSSGHLEIAKAVLGVDVEGGLTFDIVVHVATVLSTLVVLWSEVKWIFRGLFEPLSPVAATGNTPWLSRLNAQRRYALNIIVSMVPVGVVGILFKDKVEAVFERPDVVLVVVGVCLLVTAALLALTHLYKPQQREHITPLHAFIIGVAQALAVLPGLSRSGSTIATGLLLGNSRQTLAQFSFLMVIPPILGQALLTVKDLVEQGGLAAEGIGLVPLAVGFVASFVSGCFACRAMIALVKRAGLVWFAVYCALAGLAVLLFLT